MLKITIPGTDLFDEKTSSFIQTKDQTLVLEHSLVSISKWEAKWKKPFLTTDNKTIGEWLDYIKCMTITQNVSDEVYYAINNDVMQNIQKYIQDSMTATTFNSNPVNNKRQSEIITSELIYYWMVALNIPIECQKWHLNRLLTLIRICNIKNEPSKNMSRSAIHSQNAALNAARRKKFNSRG